MTKGYTKIKHSMWECEMTMEERYMLLYLLDCENRFNKNGDWFGLTDQDFINIGFGKDKEVLRRTRNSLVEHGMILFKKGGVGKKSQYKLNRKKSYCDEQILHEEG